MGGEAGGVWEGSGRLAMGQAAGEVRPGGGEVENKARPWGGGAAG